MRNHRVDLALTLEPKPDEQLSFHPLFTDELMFLVSPLHPWAIKQQVIRADIPKQNYILYNRNSYTFGVVEEYFAQEGCELKTFMQLGSMEAIKELVKLGLGVSVLAPWIAQKELQERSLVALPLGRRKLKRNWGLLQWKSRHLSLAEQTFRGLCEAVTEELSRKIAVTEAVGEAA